MLGLGKNPVGWNTLTWEWRSLEHEGTEGSIMGALKIGPFNILGIFCFLYFILRYLVPWSGVSSLAQTQTPCLWL